MQRESLCSATEGVLKPQVQYQLPNLSAYRSLVRKPKIGIQRMPTVLARRTGRPVPPYSELAHRRHGPWPNEPASHEARATALRTWLCVSPLRRRANALVMHAHLAHCRAQSLFDGDINIEEYGRAVFCRHAASSHGQVLRSRHSFCISDSRDARVRSCVEIAQQLVVYPGCS